MTGDNPLERARRSESAEDARALYEEWAEQYDDDVFETMGVTGSRRIADLLAEHVTERRTSVLDLGCGTGVVGRHLVAHGFGSLTGVDFSPAMLAVARRRDIYRQLVEGDLRDPPPFAARFGASVSAGTFTTGHVTADAVPGLLALHSPGATLAWAIAPTFWRDFESALRTASVEILTSDLEPIRRDHDDRSRMVVAQLPPG